MSIWIGWTGSTLISGRNNKFVNKGQKTITKDISVNKSSGRSWRRCKPPEGPGWIPNRRLWSKDKKALEASKSSEQLKKKSLSCYFCPEPSFMSGNFVFLESREIYQILNAQSYCFAKKTIKDKSVSVRQLSHALAISSSIWKPRRCFSFSYWKNSKRYLALY